MMPPALVDLAIATGGVLAAILAAVAFNWYLRRGDLAEHIGVTDERGPLDWERRPDGYTGRRRAPQQATWRPAHTRRARAHPDRHARGEHNSRWRPDTLVSPTQAIEPGTIDRALARQTIARPFDPQTVDHVLTGHDPAGF